jgi:hypothetical protein
VEERPVSEPVRYLPGGLRTVARTHVPGVGTILIRAKRYRFQGNTYFNLSDLVERPDGSGGGGDFRPEGRAALSWTFEGDCRRAGGNATIVVYGLLRAPADTALAYAAGVPHRLRTAVIPAGFHAGGAAAYAVLSAPPERIVVRTPAGRTVVDEDIGGEGGPTRCEGASTITYARKKG